MGKIMKGGVPYSGGTSGGGASDLSDLNDVNISSATDGQVLTYDSNSGEWVNDTISVTVDAEDVDYDNTTSGLTADDVQEAIDEVVDNLDDKAEYVELTQLEYDALSPAEKSNGTLYFITDANGNGEQFQPIIYSTTEREIGVFTDGKPLYTITATFTTPSSTAYQQVDLGITAGTVDKIWLAHASVQKSTLSYEMSQYTTSPSGNKFGGLINNSPSLVSFDYRVGSEVQNGEGIVTVYYTKTTDTAGSGTWTPQGVPAIHYSENEQIVGTWIDGSTLYEKTFDLSNVTFTDNAWNSDILGTASSGILIRKFDGCFGLSGNYGLFPLCYYRNSSEYFTCSTNSDASDLQVRPNMNAGTNVIGSIITIQYTKSSS